MNQKKIREPPKVTGLSPKEGHPGTKVTIRGENLGINAKDLYGLTICGVNCVLLADWISPSKIICRTTNCRGTGDVIVTTKSAGVGTCTVKFRSVQFLPNPLQECPIWIDESAFFERHLTTIHRPSSPLQGGPEDPLGLSVESASVLSDEELTSMFPMGSSNLAHKNFEPVWYLIENHSSTSFDDLKKGLVHVQKQSSSLKTEGPQTFIKSNLGTFMNCQDILAAFASHLPSQRHKRWKARSSTEVWIDNLQTPNESTAIHGSLVTHEPLGVPLPDVDEDQEEGEEVTPRGYTLEKLEESLIQCNNNAQRIFKSVLKRKDRADSTRNALNVLNRFKFLFHLPITIERNIKKPSINSYTTSDSERCVCQPRVTINPPICVRAAPMNCGAGCNSSIIQDIVASEQENTRRQVEDLKERVSSELQDMKQQLEALQAAVSSIARLLEGTRGSVKTTAVSRSVTEKSMNTVQPLMSVSTDSSVIYPKDCSEILSRGVMESGVYTVQPLDSGEAFQVYCDMETDGGGWTVFQRRKDGSVDFYLDFANYSRGFGHLEGEFWLGNNNLHRLTAQGEYDLRVDLSNFENITAYAVYSSFSIADVSDNYRLTLGNYSGTAGDSLGYHNSQTFKTTGTCAQNYHAAWWYNNCYNSNLNGVYFHEAKNDSKGIKWYGLLGSKSLKTSEMKIRSKI